MGAQSHARRREFSGSVAVREQLRQLDQREPVVVDEHRGLGQHHGAAGGIVEALGDPVRVAPARGDAVQTSALEGVGLSHEASR